jgi:hypothetical protein
MKINVTLRVALFLLLPLLVSGQNAGQDKDSWSDWKFLIGKWDAGESSGVPGAASKGGFTLQPDLGGKILLRRNHAEYPAAQGRPAFSHDDLMIVYRDGNATRAFYDDNEGHAIHYVVNVSEDKRQIVFVSEQTTTGPQYRLTYQDFQPGAVKVLFEIAPPGKSGQFAKYVEATVHRKS